MKAVILAGGQGTRLREETEYRPKPLVRIGREPILWHIMKIFHAHGIYDFEIALGFKGDDIKEYFLNRKLFSSDLIIDYRENSPVTLVETHEDEKWIIRLTETGLNTNTGGRIFALRDKLDEVFLCTYGDGVANVDVKDLIAFHRSHGKLATVTAVHPSARFGSIEILNDGSVSSFAEKPASNHWINGGFFVFNKGVIDYLKNDSILEREPLENLASDGELMAWRHEGFWHPMDTIRDTQYLNELWNRGEAPWKIW